MAKVLVTGASGFIGFHVVRALTEKGHEIACLARRQSNLQRLAGIDFHRIEGDVRDPDSLTRAVAGQDAVLHLAGLVKAVQVEELYEVNCQGMANVARACAATSTPPRLVVLSSLAAMGPSRPDRPRVASDSPAPVSHYGRSKLAGERELRKWAQEVPTTILRPPIIFGEGDAATLELFRPIARYGIHVVPSWRTHWASLLHADDLAAAVVRAAARGRRILPEVVDPTTAAEGCYFLAAERDVTFAEFGRMMGTALGRRWTLVLPLSPVAVSAVGLCAEAVSRLRGRSWYFNVDKAREILAGSWTCSPAAAASELQFAVAKPLEDRLRQTADWYREKRWL